MICRNPYVKGFLAVGCGQCHRCRMTRRRVWTHRLLLESFSHKFSSFVTLTYSDEFIPPGGTLDERDVSLWLKRLRKAVYPQKLRYYIVGEYGSEGERPHYHAAIFGLQGCHYPLQNKFQRAVCECSQCALIRNTWKKGRTDCAYLELDSAQYIAGYVMKRKLRDDDPEFGDTLRGRLPEKAWMSRHPGIGTSFLEALPEALMGYLPDGDVPTVLQHGKKILPLGRYLRGVLREKYGMGERKAPKEALDRWADSMQELLEEGINSKAIALPTKVSFKKYLIERSKQTILNLEQKSKIFQKGTL